MLTWLLATCALPVAIVSSRLRHYTYAHARIFYLTSRCSQMLCLHSNRRYIPELCVTNTSECTPYKASIDYRRRTSDADGIRQHQLSIVPNVLLCPVTPVNTLKSYNAMKAIVKDGRLWLLLRLLFLAIFHTIETKTENWTATINTKQTRN